MLFTYELARRLQTSSVTANALHPGVVVRSRPIGLLKMTDEAGEDTKLLAVPIDKLTPIYRSIETARDLPEVTLAQITHFFAHYKDLEKGKWVKIKGWQDARAAKKYMCESTCQACPDNWNVNTETPPISATAITRWVESPLPTLRQDKVAAAANAIIRMVGISQSVPRAMPMTAAIGTCNHSNEINALLAVSRKASRSLLPLFMLRFPCQC